MGSWPTILLANSTTLEQLIHTFLEVFLAALSCFTINDCTGPGNLPSSDKLIAHFSYWSSIVETWPTNSEGERFLEAFPIYVSYKRVRLSINHAPEHRRWQLIFSTHLIWLAKCCILANLCSIYILKIRKGIY